ncbi:MAG: hypothetical protein NZ761_05570 [Dehalococcoidia bacterium]|jgi:hypothetical protein|nr:hypothetical protein [Dehalococcoidia bacterium]
MKVEPLWGVIGMKGIYYDRSRRMVHRVVGQAEPGWTLVTHDLGASVHHCRRILGEWLPPDELRSIDWSGLGSDMPRIA